MKFSAARLTAVDLLSLTKPSTYSIGLASENDICFDDQQVSRRHAFLIADTTGLEVVDRDSTFGTFIGDERINGRASWRDSRRIRIDPYEIAVRTENLIRVDDVMESPKLAE